MYKKIHWTEHIKLKMRQYGLSQSKITSILRRPDRTEQGIAEGTMAAMRTNKVFGLLKPKPVEKEKGGWRPAKAPGEIWVMYRDNKGIRNVISAWRYPGVSKPGESVPVPADMREELLKQLEELTKDE